MHPLRWDCFVPNLIIIQYRLDRLSKEILEGKVRLNVNLLAEKSALVKNFLLSLPGLLRREWRPVFAVGAANIIFAFAVNYFTLPYRFPDLGISGLAVLTNYVLPSGNWRGRAARTSAPAAGGWPRGPRPSRPDKDFTVFQRHENE